MYCFEGDKKRCCEVCYGINREACLRRNNLIIKSGLYIKMGGLRLIRFSKIKLIFSFVF